MACELCELRLTCRPFPVDAPDKPLALKPLEEAAEELCAIADEIASNRSKAVAA